MRSVNIFVAFLLLPVGVGMAAEPASPTPDSIAAFRDICLKTAPSFSGALEAAKAYGIDDSGFNKDQSLGIQVKDNECVVTTMPEATNKNLTKQLLAAVSEFLGVSVGKKVPASITIQNQSFALHHDRDGGEAFVLMKRK